MNIDKSVLIAEGARVIGDGITIGKESSVWCNAVIRCDEGKKITIGERTNIQDLCTLHIDPDYDVYIGNDVTIGHMCLIHGCTIGDNTLIGMGTIIMNGAVIGNNCIIGAGSLITEGKVIPDGTIAFGRPARVVRELTEEQIASNKHSADWYVDESRSYLKRAAERKCQDQ